MLQYIFILRIIFILVFVFPLFHSYFSFVPESAKYITETFIVILICLIILENKVNIKFKGLFARYLITSFSVLIVLYIGSALLNSSNIIFLLLKLRYPIYGLFIFLLFDSLLSNKNEYSTTIERWFKNIFYLQLIILPLQYIGYNLIPGFSSSILVATNHIDSAAGTIGRGTGTISIFILIYFLFQFTIKKNKNSFYFLIPLLFTFSGGANLLLIMALLLIAIINPKVIFERKKMILGFIMLIFVAWIFSEIILKENIFRYSYNYIGLQIQNISKSGQDNNEIFSNQLSRTSGYTYLLYTLKIKDALWYGLGPDALATSNTLNISSNKMTYQLELILSDSLTYLAQFGLSLLIYVVVWLKILLSTLFLTKKNKKISGIFIILTINFLSFFYTSTSESLPYLFLLMYIFAYANQLASVKNVNMSKYKTKL